MIVTVEQLKAITNQENFKTGWREDLSDEHYHGIKNAVNFSSLKHIEKSEFAFAKSFWGPPKEPTASMKFGTLVHKAILEGADFKKNFVVMPEFVGFTKDGKVTKSSNATDIIRQRTEWLDAQPKNAIIITIEERNKIFAMLDSVLSNDKALKLLSDGKPELSGFWTDEKTGINLRIKPDFLAFNLGVLVDLKTSQDARWEYFRKSVENYSYFLQMAMYSEGVKHITGKEPEHKAWLVVESDGAHECRIHEVSSYYDDIGRWEYRNCLDKLKKAIDENSFPQGGLEVLVGEPTAWFLKKYITKGVIDYE